MKIHFWSIGKSHDKYVKEGIEDFSKRINRYYPAEWKILPAAKQNVNSLPADIKKKELDIVNQALGNDDYLILLDETGQQLTSPGLAKFIETRAMNGIKNVVFLIGGAYGVDEQLKKRANYIWSLSPLVFPHQIVRLLLAEQVYRACTIIKNEKYHHE